MASRVSGSSGDRTGSRKLLPARPSCRSDQQAHRRLQPGIVLQLLDVEVDPWRVEFQGRLAIEQVLVNSSRRDPVADRISKLIADSSRGSSFSFSTLK